ncbi:MAG: 30S ribosomal protein S21 [Gemmatimonadetes bacterium 13_1_40CM_4_69_8]|nr:MAG: 30S ribosomal protein S21 [Gemmatimonadetes bacterium 13_1_40CM_4_69_8]
MEITLGENDRLDWVLKKFRRQITRAGLFQDLKRKRFYESRAAQRRRKDKSAARRKAKAALKSGVSPVWHASPVP